MAEISLAEPLLTDGGDEGNIDTGISSSLTDNVKEALENKEALETAPHLEYEASNYSISDAPTSESPPVKTIRLSAPQNYDVLRTSNKPVCVTCKFCNTTCETTVVEAFGTSTCLWVCVLLVLCFPIAWLPFFWNDVSTNLYCVFFPNKHEILMLSRL